MISVGVLKGFDLEVFLDATESENGNISEKVFFFILKEIFKGRYKVGSRITEAQIVEKLSVSNGPVREAFARLRSDGWIETIPNIGSVIINYRDPDRFHSLFTDRRIIEVGCAVELAKTASYRQLGELEEIIDNIEESLSAQNANLYRDSDLRFHYKTVKFIASPRLFNLWRHGTLQLFCFGYMGPENEFLTNSVDVKCKEASHRTLFNAIASHDEEETRKLFLTHLEFPLKNRQNTHK